MFDAAYPGGGRDSYGQWALPRSYMSVAARRSKCAVAYWRVWRKADEGTSGATDIE